MRLFRVSRAALLVALLALPSGVAPGYAGPFGDASAVEDSELADMRGGIRTPDGIEISVGIDIQTRVDGILALRTIVSTDDGSIRVFAGGTSKGGGSTGSEASVAKPQANGTASAAASDMASPPPSVMVARSASGTTITVDRAPVSDFRVSSGPIGTIDLDGAVEIDVVAGGDSLQTRNGAISLTRDQRGTTIALESTDLSVRHLIGTATGVIQANTAADRTVSTVATINIELMNAMPSLATSLLRVQQIALDAVGSRLD